LQTILYGICAATGWIAAAYIFRLQRREPSALRGAMWIAFLAFGSTDFLNIPQVTTWLDAATAPNTATLLSDGFVMVIIAWPHAALMRLALPPDQANRMARRWAWLSVAAYAIMILLYGAILTLDTPVPVSEEYTRHPLVGAYLVVFAAVFGTYGRNITRLCWGYAQICGQTWLSRGLRCTAAGATLCFVWCVLEIGSMIAKWLGYFVPSEETASAAVLAVAGLLMTIGLTMPAWGPTLDTIPTLVAYRRLGPLWRDLISRVPDVELDPSLRNRLTALSDVDYAITRRIAEIRDARLALMPYIDHRVSATAAKLADDAGLTGDNHTAVVEAAQLRSAIQAHAANQPAESDQPADLYAPAGGQRGEARWLAKVAWAYAASPHVDGALSHAKDIKTTEVR